MDPVLGGEVVEGQQRVQVIEDLRDGLGVLGAVSGLERLHRGERMRLVLGVPDLGQRLQIKNAQCPFQPGSEPACAPCALGCHDLAKTRPRAYGTDDESRTTISAEHSRDSETPLPSLPGSAVLSRTSPASPTTTEISHAPTTISSDSTPPPSHPDHRHPGPRGVPVRANTSSPGGRLRHAVPTRDGHHMGRFCRCPL